jgi:hypothetical protein
MARIQGWSFICFAFQVIRWVDVLLTPLIIFNGHRAGGVGRAGCGCPVEFHGAAQSRAES